MQAWCPLSGAISIKASLVLVESLVTSIHSNFNCLPLPTIEPQEEQLRQMIKTTTPACRTRLSNVVCKKGGDASVSKDERRKKRVGEVTRVIRPEKKCER